jgi:beta-barrel assembly-enhancing protease
VRAGGRRPAPLVVALFGVLLLLGGCISETREQQLGDEMAATINTQVPLVRNPLLNAYVSSLGRSIAAVSGRPDLDYRFYIVNSAQVNAFALPGGHIYITRGLIERTSNGSELAGVLAHEIGHVVERHGVQKLERHLRTGSLVNVLYSIFLGGVGGEPELLQRNALQFAGVVWNASHSREQEEAADRLAVQYLIDAGVDPHGVLTLLETLLDEERADASSPAASWFSTHPLTETRIAQTRQEIQSELGDEGQLVALHAELEFTSYPAFLRLVAALPPAPDAHH